MTVTDSEIACALELFSGIDGPSHRKPTGALLLCAHATPFATADDAEIYIKARGRLADEVAAAGSRQFSVKRSDGSLATSGCWTLPDRARDDPGGALDWANRALAALARSAAN